MSGEVRQEFDVLVVGAGPAGIAASVRAAEAGVRVGLVDDNANPGGQIWRGDSARGNSVEASAWLARLSRAGVVVLSGARVFDQPGKGVLLAEGHDQLHVLTYDKLVVATGARERFLPFPGWTLPNVVGAGGLQAMVKSGVSIRGKKVVIAGTGPLLLAVAAYLRQHGAEIAMMCEQATWNTLASFGAAMVRYPRKLAQALQLKRQLSGTKFKTNSWVVSAHGKNAVEHAVVSCGGTTEVVRCDYIACGFHLVPNTELPQLLGCQMQDGFVQVDDFQRTTIEGILCAGEPTGIGGVELSLVEGEIAGLIASKQVNDARRLFRQRGKARDFARLLNRTFQLRPELKNLPSPDTIVCRCEDIRYSQLAGRTSWRSAKLLNRCGMGPCQGRVCGPAAEFLFSWSPQSVRPPIFPVRVESLAVMPVQQNQDECYTLSGGTK